MNRIYFDSNYFDFNFLGQDNWEMFLFLLILPLTWII